MEGGESGQLRRVVEQAMTAYNIPGIAVVAERNGKSIASLFLGSDASGHPLGPSSIFPIASITKLATALAVLRLADAGELALDDPLADDLPGAAAAQAGVTLRTLLSHTSGLPLDPPDLAQIYRPGLDWSMLARACARTPLRWPPATRVQYSNVGYGLLATLVEKKTGQSFAAALRSIVLDPLGVEGYLGVEPPRPPVVLADVRGPDARTPLEPFNSAFWRSLALPWAGLLTTAEGALRLVQAYQGVPMGFLRLATLAAATRNQTDDLSGGYSPPLFWPRCPWGLGPEIRDEKTPHWSPREAGPDSYGHAGASGCVVWVDPTADVAWAILGSRAADNGWLIRRGPTIGAAILTS